MCTKDDILNFAYAHNWWLTINGERAKCYEFTLLVLSNDVNNWELKVSNHLVIMDITVEKTKPGSLNCFRDDRE